MKRFLTALVLIPISLYLILLAPGWLLLASAAVVSALCYYEYCALAAVYGIGSLGPLGYGAGLLVLAIDQEALPVLALIGMLAIALSMRAGNLAEVLPRAATLVLGILYVFGSWRCALLLRGISPYWLLYALSLNWVADIAAYYAGRTLGKHKIAPRISPAKTWEGALASLVVAVVFGIAYLGRFQPSIAPVEAAALSVVVNAAGQLGDLSESALKRGAGVKDSGAMLPGHGGWLDRLDSALFSFPLVYLGVRFWFLRT